MHGWTVAGMLVLAALAALAGCRDAAPPSATGTDTSVLGARGQDRAGPAIPPPPLPAGVQAQVVRSGPDGALALWVQEGRVMTATQAAGQPWSAPQLLEDLYGDASRPRLASNGQGVALAIWQHTIGSIESLRSSRWEAGRGWAAPDVVPGALPRPRREASEPPRLRLDADGNGWASWPSGFAPDDVQTARYLAGSGWERAESPALAARPGASAAHP